MYKAATLDYHVSAAGTKPSCHSLPKFYHPPVNYYLAGLFSVTNEFGSCCPRLHERPIASGRSTTRFFSLEAAIAHSVPLLRCFPLWKSAKIIQKTAINFKVQPPQRQKFHLQTPSSGWSQQRQLLDFFLFCLFFPKNKNLGFRNCAVIYIKKYYRLNYVCCDTLTGIQMQF